MRRVLFLLTLALVVAAPASERVAACGDKFLQAGRGILQRYYAPRYAASVLVFAPLRSGGASLLKEQKFQAALTSAGHRLVVVHDDAGVSRALKAGVDLALVGQDDLAVFGHLADATQPAPTVLRVKNNKPTKSDEEACKRQYDCQLKASDRLDDFLKAMDDAMKVRTKAAVGKKR